MVVYDLNLLDYIHLAAAVPALIKHQKAKFEKGQFPKGTIVACSTTNFKTAEDLQEVGRVAWHPVNPIELVGPDGEDHRDGEYGEVFVQCWDRHRELREAGLERKLSCSTNH